MAKMMVAMKMKISMGVEAKDEDDKDVWGLG